MPSLTAYHHTQSTPSATWTIVHNLGVYPVIDILVLVNSTLTKIIPANIVVNDLNTVTITFSTPFAGEARLV